MKEGKFAIDASVWCHKTKGIYDSIEVTTNATGKVTKEEDCLLITVKDDNTSEIICEMKVSDILFALHDFIERDL